MNKEVINEFVYDENAINEVMAFWCKKEFKKLYISSFILLIIGTAYFIAFKNSLGVVAVLLSIVSFLSGKFAMRKNIKAEKERALLLNKEEYPIFNITINDKIIMKSDKTERSVPFESVKGFDETDNFIVVFLQGKMTIPLKKDSFIKGSADECIEILNSNIIKK